MRQGVLVILALVATAMPSLSLAKPAPSTYPALEIAMPSAQTKSMAAAELYKALSPSIYVIMAAKDPETFKRGKNLYTGSAVAITQTLALTNCHIVNKRKAIVLGQKTAGGLGVVVASDPKTDRCIIRAEGLKLNPIRGVRHYNDLSVGEKVYTIGNPSGLEATLGEGIVSGLRNQAGVRYVQTSAPISHGSSGGGLFDERGNLLGITAFKIEDSENLNFAIAAEDYWNKIVAAKSRKAGRSGDLPRK